MGFFRNIIQGFRKRDQPPVEDLSVKTTEIPIVEQKPKEQAPTIGTLAEEAGLFPWDVEEVIKAMHQQGIVKCMMHEGELYVIFIEDKDEVMSSIKEIVGEMDKSEDDEQSQPDIPGYQ